MNFSAQKYPIMWISFLTESGKMCLWDGWVWSWQHFHFSPLGEENQWKNWSISLSENVQLCCHADSSLRFCSLFIPISKRNTWFVLLFFPLYSSFLGSQVLSLKSNQVSRAVVYQEQIFWGTTLSSRFLTCSGNTDTNWC